MTERLFNLGAAEALRRVGIDALMAHKGQPELRIVGLDAVSGEPLALPGLPKPAARMAFSTKLQGKMADDDAKPAKGKKAQASSDDEEETADESADDDGGSAEPGDGSGDDDGSASSDSSLDDLLASLGDDGSGSRRRARTASGAGNAERGGDGPGTGGPVQVARRLSRLPAGRGARRSRRLGRAGRGAAAVLGIGRRRDAVATRSPSAEVDVLQRSLQNGRQGFAAA